MAILKEIENNQGIKTNYHTLFWCQLISSPKVDKVSAIIKSFVSKEKYLEGKEAVEQTELSFELQKNFNESLREEIYKNAKELEKFKDAQDDI